MKPAIVCPNCGHRILPNMTAREQKVLGAVRSSHGSRGFAPTIQELARDLKIPETTIKRDVEALVDKGHLFRPFRGSRNLYPAIPPEPASREQLRAHQ